MGSSAAHMVARKERQSHEPKSTRGVCDGSTQNRQFTWLSHKTKTGGSAGGDGSWARREALMPGDTLWHRGACGGRMRTMAKA
jgi:hypothetical protein